MAGCKFRRQHTLGPFIVDFVCLERHLIVEVDGGQHAEQAQEDRSPTENLESLGFRVVRFWNNQVLGEIDSVLAVIRRALTPAPRLRPQRGRG
jgi:adenine-specific DNA-methyltransferase